MMIEDVGDRSRSVEPLPPRPCDVMPPQLRERLIRASQTPISHPEDLSRVKAINAAIEWGRFHFSEYFR